MWQHEAEVTASIITTLCANCRVKWLITGCMGHFGKSRSEKGDMSTEPFGVEVAAWIHSHEGSKMWSIGPRDVRHKHCLWWSPGLSNSKFDNRWASQVVKSELPRMTFSRTSIVVQLYDNMKDTMFFSAGLTFSSSGCCGSLAALVTHATYKWIPLPFWDSAIPQWAAKLGNAISQLSQL